MRIRRACALATTSALALGLAVSGCGHSGPPNYGQQYLNILAPYVTASEAFSKTYQAHLNWTFPQVLSAEQPQLNAGKKFDVALMKDSWPIAYRYDVGLLAQANALYFADLENPKATELQVGNALNLTAEDDARVREDLNLPIVQDEATTS